MARLDPAILVDTALAAGASHARVISTRLLRVDPRVRLKCQVPLCPSYGNNLMCPPRLPAVEEFQTALTRYSRAVLIQVNAPASGSEDSVKAAVYAGARTLHRAVNTVEKAAFQAGAPLAAGLIGGACRLCDTCAALAGTTVCKHPFEARPSMEGMGIDVTGTLKNLGLDLNFPASSGAVWTGCVLID